MSDEMNVLIAGVGGQGALTLAGVLADAAMKSGINIIAGEVHGMAQRGGSVFVHVRMGPKVRGPIIPIGNADVIVSLELVEALRYLGFLAKESSIVVSTTKTTPPLVWAGMAKYPSKDDIVNEYKKKSDSVYLIDSLDIANRTGNSLTANIVLLGALVAVAKLPFEKDVILESLASVLPPKIVEVNKSAFELGWQEAAKGNI